MIGRYDPDRGRFTIEFEYIDDEPSALQLTDGGVKVYAGKHSRKLQRISIAIDQPPHDQTAVIALKTKVLHAVDAARQNELSDDLNRTFTRRILDDDFEALTEAVQAA